MIVLVVLLMLVGVGVVGFGVAQTRRPLSDPAAYLESLDNHGAPDEFEQVLSESFLARVLAPLGKSVLDTVGRVTPIAQRERVRSLLQHAGLSGTLRAEDFLAIQLLAAGGGVVLGLFYLAFGGGSSVQRLVILLLLVLVGVLGPQSWLNRKVAERKHDIFMDMPDVLDLLAISVEAGVGFEGAMAIVCQHFASPLATELARTLREMELGLPRREALQNLKKRTEVPELSNFVLALTQADALGMPIGRVLHTQAVEMRTKRRQYARERAGKLPVKILFPLILFIFPAILIVVLGPAASKIGHAFH